MVKDRIAIRGTAVAAGVLAATSALTVTVAKAAIDDNAAEPAVMRVGPLPDGERAVKAARAARERRASRATLRTGDPRRVAASMAATRYGWGSGNLDCLDALWTRESGWDATAANPSTGAYGIPQALPGSKMSAFGADWRTNPVTQIEWGLDYISDVYDNPCGAWDAFRAKGWY